MFAVLWLAAAQAVEPCVADFVSPYVGSSQVRLMARPDPLVRRFVTSEGLASIRFAMAGAGSILALDAIPTTAIVGTRTLEDVIELGGGTRDIDGSLRLKGGQPRVVLDGIALTSELE